MQWPQWREKKYRWRESNVTRVCSSSYAECVSVVNVCVYVVQFKYRCHCHLLPFDHNTTWEHRQNRQNANWTTTTSRILILAVFFCFTSVFRCYYSCNFCIFAQAHILYRYDPLFLDNCTYNYFLFRFFSTIDVFFALSRWLSIYRIACLARFFSFPLFHYFLICKMALWI